MGDQIMGPATDVISIVGPTTVLELGRLTKTVASNE